MIPTAHITEWRSRVPYRLGELLGRPNYGSRERADRVVACFTAYMEAQELRVSRAEYEANLSAKIADRRFLGDTAPLLARGITYDPTEAYAVVMDTVVSRLPGAPWRGGGTPAPASGSV
ncbi:MAG: hypothetical protein RQ745_13005 [Longimicrobiales bacterium]|nr:hypothetical protein [Longimicrobiales bacterium]